MATEAKSSWFKGIKGKLLFAALLPLVGFGVLFITSYNGFNKDAQIITTAHESLVPNLDSIGSMRYNRNRFGYKALQTIYVSQDDADRTANLTEAKRNLSDFKQQYENYLNAPFLPGEAELHNDAKSSMQNTVAAMTEILDLLDKNDPSKTQQAKALLNGTFNTEGVKAQKFLSDVINLYRTTAKAQAVEAAESRQKTMSIVIFVSLCASFSIFGILLWLAHRVSSDVQGIAQNLAEAARNVSTSVEQLNEAGNTLSSSSTEAAASLEETVASLEEMTSMVKMGSDNAKQAAALATSSCDSAETGAREIQNLIKSMEQISTSSKKIEEIISVIDDIAFQTNLLALNAAVEAARAGEQGKGFAVVAEAVRALAQRSAASAKDISGLIKESVEQVDQGSDIADKSGTLLSNIVTSIKKVSDLNNEIATASQEQATGIEQINKAMSQLDQAGQANAASAEEIAATSGEISHLAITTQDLTVDLNKIVLGSSSEGSAFVQSAPTKAASKKNKVVPFKKPAPKVQRVAASQIPLDDEEESRGKIDDASGF